jgi:hypothetical protein
MRTRVRAVRRVLGVTVRHARLARLSVKLRSPSATFDRAAADLADQHYAERV